MFAYSVTRCRNRRGWWVYYKDESGRFSGKFKVGLLEALYWRARIQFGQKEVENDEE